MGEKKFTFIELHLDGDTQFGPRTLDQPLPFGDREESSDLEAETDEDDAVTTDDSAGGKAVGTIVALVVLVGIAAAAKKFRGGDDETDLETEEEPDVIVN